MTNANDDQVRAIYLKLLDFAPTNELLVSYWQTTGQLVGIIWDMKGLEPRIEEVD